MASRAADVVNIDLSWGTDVVTTFIELVAQYKGLRTEYVALESDTAPAVLFQGVQVDGLWPIIHFIKAVRPYPEIAPNNIPKRAFVQSLTERVLYRPQVLSLLHQHYNKQGKIEIPPPPTLLDFAIVARAGNRWSLKHYPWISQVARACGPYLVTREGL